MRILSVNNTADIYGASRCQERLFSRFVEDGHALVAVLPCEGPLVSLLTERGATVLIHPSLSILERPLLKSFRGKLCFIINFPVSVLWLALTIVKYKIDVVHTNTGTIISPALAAALTRRPHIWHIREFLSEFQSAWRYFQFYITKLSAAVVAISSAVKDQFDKHLADQVSVIYDGLPLAEFETVSEKEISAWRFGKGIGAGPAIAVVGRIKWQRKGQEVLVRAAHLLHSKYPAAKYFVVGSPSPGNEEHLANLKRLISELSLDESFVFTGDILDPRVAFASFDVTVVPSVRPEPFGCVVIESMALNTPVIGSKAGGIAEQIVDGSTGFLFEPGNEHALARALEELFDNHELRRLMGERGRQRYLDCFGLEKSYEGFLRLFLKVSKCGKPENGAPAENTSACRQPVRTSDY